MLLHVHSKFLWCLQNKQYISTENKDITPLLSTPLLGIMEPIYAAKYIFWSRLLQLSGTLTSVNYYTYPQNNVENPTCTVELYSTED